MSRTLRRDPVCCCCWRLNRTSGEETKADTQRNCENSISFSLFLCQLYHFSLEALSPFFGKSFTSKQSLFIHHFVTGIKHQHCWLKTATSLHHVGMRTSGKSPICCLCFMCVFIFVFASTISRAHSVCQYACVCDEDLHLS